LESLLAGLVWHVDFEPWHDLIAQHTDQARIDCTADHEERQPVHRIDPIIGRAAQTEPLPGNITPRQSATPALGAALLRAEFAVFAHNLVSVPLLKLLLNGCKIY
jgi:hypothetical protein